MLPVSRGKRGIYCRGFIFIRWGSVLLQSIGSRELERSSTYRDPLRGNSVISPPGPHFRSKRYEIIMAPLRQLRLEALDFVAYPVAYPATCRKNLRITSLATRCWFNDTFIIAVVFLIQPWRDATAAS